MVLNVVLIPRWVYRALLLADSTALHVWDHTLRNFVTVPEFLSVESTMSITEIRNNLAAEGVGLCALRWHVTWHKVDSGQKRESSIHHNTKGLPVLGVMLRDRLSKKEKQGLLSADLYNMERSDWEELIL
uniref:Uncharacterized protein n=1 Tax=Eutreptiella gymnastica TaxID=73025 RepID=A0A7S4G9M4_9EUGL